MTDLAHPPVHLFATQALGDGVVSVGQMVQAAWPAPPGGEYDRPMAEVEGLPCEIEGLNGRLMKVTLVKLDTQRGYLEVMSAGLRAPMPLRFAQFRRLSLTTLLEPLSILPSHLVKSYRLRPRGGTERSGLSVGYVESPHGIFLFEPQDNAGSLRRVFVPASAFDTLTIGQTLIQGFAPQASSTPMMGPGGNRPPASGNPASGTGAAGIAASAPSRPVQGMPSSGPEAPAPQGAPHHTASAFNAVGLGPPTRAAWQDAGSALAALPRNEPESAADEVMGGSPLNPFCTTPGDKDEDYGSLSFELATPAQRPAPRATVADPMATGIAAARAHLGGKPVTTADELLQALDSQSRMPMLRMGDALVALGYINETQLKAALALQSQEHGTPLGQIFVREGLIDREVLQQALIRKMGYPLVDVGEFEADNDALLRVPLALAERLAVMPLLINQGRLVVAMVDPTQGKLLDELEFATGLKVVPALATAGELPYAISAQYQRMSTEVSKTMRPGPGGESEPVDAADLLASLEQETAASSQGEDESGAEQSDNALVRLINQMILEAQSAGVSDIHIESMAGREKVRVRFRRDGVLRPYMELPYTYRSAILARVKIMCDLDISEKRKPQDGKISFGRFHAGSKLELRVATIPTANGLEDAVLRLLASAKPLPLGEIGLSPRNLQQLQGIVERPYGMFLCVGPTGSGKTTTLHSALGYINQPDRKIWTAEDPVEITQPGLRQVQVNPKIDWTFARALRAFLRADPDVIMVGEIRDKETATVAVESSLTGHLVLSTLHTNSAPETVTRLLDMGMDPFNFADALLGVLAQRLVRRICSHCRTSQVMSDSLMQEALGDYRHAYAGHPDSPTEDQVLSGWRERFGLDGKLQHHHAGGCEKCGGTGLRGRAGIHELMVVSRELRRLIQTGGRVDEMQAVAMSQGMLTLRQDGIEKVLQGVTSLAEVRASSN
jgi:type II secretory ATPase GspE/PulE/Tfp pilus assembly ATPase PilB-like protein